MNLTEFVLDADRVKRNLAWRQLRETQEMFELLRDSSVPRTLSSVTGESALYAHGIQVGYNEFISIFSGVEDAYKSMVRQVKLNSLSPDYGARNIMKAGE